MPARPTGRPAPDGSGHAVVVGASMAGLLAARALAGHVERVTLVERDRLPAGAQQRRGVPQGRQVHALLARGLLSLETAFPGFGADLERAGAVPVRLPRDVLILSRSGWIDRRAPGWAALSATRPLIEATVRRRVLELPGVTLLDGHEVTALAASGDGRLVRGVTLRPVDGDGETFFAEADLVVDASGRGSRAPAWLADLGCPTPERTTIDADITYASRLYRIPDGSPADWKMLMIFGDPVANPRTGYLMPVEGGCWLLGLMGANGAHPTPDEEGYAAFMRSLRSPVLADAVAAADPLGEARVHRGTSNRRWHFERMSRWPERFVVLGDAAVAFDPVYGQGMSNAALAAETLDECLRAHRRRRPEGDLTGLARRFQRVLARRSSDPWMFATGEDLRYPGTTGGSAGPLVRLRHRYLDRIEAAATSDPAVTDVYARALGMLERPSALFRPRIVAAAVRARGGNVPPPVPAPPAEPRTSPAPPRGPAQGTSAEMPGEGVPR